MSDDLFSQVKQPKPKPAAKAAVKTAVAEALPAGVVYEPVDGDRWQVERFEALAGELPVLELAPEGAMESRAPLAMRLFHELVSRGPARGWRIVRRLFGVAPLVAPAEADLDDLRVWDRAALCADQGIDAKQLQAELDTLRGVMRAVIQGEFRVEREDQGSTESRPTEGTGERLLELDDELLKRYGYPEGMFNIRQRVETFVGDGDEVEHRYEWQNREPEQNRAERDWFVALLKRWTRVLDELMTEGFARNALFNQLQIRRLEAEMANLSPTAGNYDDLAKRRAQMEKSFTDQLTAIEERFPEFANTAQKMGFRACFHDLFKAYTDYKLRNDTRLVDRVRTALEIEVDFRQHQLAPEPRYRLGQTVFIGEAIAGLWDPNWTSQLKPGLLAKLDRGMKMGIELARQDGGEALVNLEADGEEGEFPPLATGTGAERSTLNVQR